MSTLLLKPVDRCFHYLNPRLWMQISRKISSCSRSHLIDAGILIAIASVFRLLARPLHRTAFGYDEHWFVWGGWGITTGQSPYIDFTDFKPPIGFLVNAAGIAVWGFEALAYRYIMSLLVFCGLALLYFAMRSR
jgi:hypothetical protein